MKSNIGIDDSILTSNLGVVIIGSLENVIFNENDLSES